MNKRTLAIDTSTPACSAALFDGEKLIANEYKEIGRGHAEHLIPMIANLPDKGKADEIIVNCGPGSFTGIRIGLSAAKALALAWQAELNGYQCLHLVARQALKKMEPNKAVYVAMLGGHGEYFVQNFSADGTATDELLSLSPDDALNNSSCAAIAGSAAEALAKLKPALTVFPMLPDAASALELTQNCRNIRVSPIYGRAPDAQPAALG